MSTRAQHQLTRTTTQELCDLAEIEQDYQAWIDAKGDDEERTIAGDLIESLLAFARITITTTQVEICDECDEEATCFWPTLTAPVQMCDSCHHNARRSGWTPGT